MSVMEGDSVTLYFGSNEMKDGNQIRWRIGKYLLAEINVINDSIAVYDDVPDGRFRDRLKVDNQTGSLTITHITTEHARDYEVNTNQPMQTVFILTINCELNICFTFHSNTILLYYVVLQYYY